MFLVGFQVLIVKGRPNLFEIVTMPFIIVAEVDYFRHIVTISSFPHLLIMYEFMKFIG